MSNAVELELELAVSRKELAQMRLERDEALNALNTEKQAAAIAKDHAHIASQEAADIADSLQSQLRTLRDTMAAVEAAHKREVIHLTDSIREAEHSQANRDEYSQSQSKAKNLALLYEKHETGKTRESLENAKDELFKTKGALCKSTNEVRERGFQICQRENMYQRSEIARHWEVHELTEQEKFARWDKQERCTQLQTEKLRAVQQLQEKCALGFDNLLRVQAKKVETSAVLGIVCDESKQIMRQKEELGSTVALLESRCSVTSAKYEDMMDQKHQLHAELMASQASFRDATDQLDHSLKTADNLRDEVSDFHGFCNDRTIEFAGHEIS